MAVLCGSHAQHFKFMDIPIDGSIESFDAKLKAKGFVKSKEYGVQDTKTERWYDGRFAGSDVLLYVNSTSETKKVFVIDVIKFVETKKEAEKLCKYYCSAIEEKYSIERKIKQDICSTRYDIELGYIIVEYRETDYKYAVDIMYFDRINNALKRQENEQDI